MNFQGASAQPARAVAVIEPIAIRDLSERIAEFDELITKRAYELFEARGFEHGNDLDDWLRAEAELFQPSHVEVKEAEDAITVTASVDGFKARELEVSIEPRRLTICGTREFISERRTEQGLETTRRTERIYRSVNLPAEVDPSRARAGLLGDTMGATLPRVHAASRAAAAGRGA